MKACEVIKGKGKAKEKGKGKGSGKFKDISSSSTMKQLEYAVDSDSDDNTPSKHNQVIMKEILSLRFDIRQILKLTKGMKLPPGLYIQLKQTFKCHICQISPITPPVIYTRCCKNLLGCERCVDKWYSGNEGRARNCPLCRYERGLPETSRLNGLDDFLHSISPLFADDDDDDDDDLEQQAVIITNMPLHQPLEVPDNDSDDFQ